ncbi:MAG TPA: aconitate hydratase AcnA [Chloroflexota bacterium]|nr:aconitate hydratase AcnA [Chloroflexota bacterium]
MAGETNPFGARTKLEARDGVYTIYRLSALADRADLTRLPFSIKVLLENLLRHCDGYLVSEEDVVKLARWNARNVAEQELPFRPARALLQDFTGIPCVVDLAAMRSAVKRLGGDPQRINPTVPVDLVIDHSVQVDFYGSDDAFALNVQKEYERNGERYAFLRWAQTAFKNFQVVPPGTGIIHQVNIEYLASVVQTRSTEGGREAYPDTVVGTDSHTTMINGLGVLGWGVGGIEAEAVMLSQPFYMLAPEVVGVRLTGQLREGTTATDAVLTITQMLRQHGVVSKFVEYTGPGLDHLSVFDRATIANMSPEYGATCGFFPIDDETLRYMTLSGRSPEQIDLVERYSKEQGLFREPSSAEPIFSELLELDLASVESSLAGPRRPQDRVTLGQMKSAFDSALPTFISAPSSGGGTAVAEKVAARKALVTVEGQQVEIGDGAVSIAAITSCTNTTNPSVMVGAGLLAKHAVERGLQTKPWVKTSLAPGSTVVTDYLQKAGLWTYLNQLRFNLVGYGCTTCIGNSGSVLDPIARASEEHDIVMSSVLSGNRNFEGRINPLVKMSYLASPPLVVAYALAGTVDIDLTTDPIGTGKNGEAVYLRDIWPTQQEVNEAMERSISPEMFKSRYADVFEGDVVWQKLPVPEGDLYSFDDASTYVREPNYFDNLTPEPAELKDIRGGRVLALLGDSITTDHISPAGSIKTDSPAGRYLIEHGTKPVDFNTYGARRGNHEVMVRGTFANVRLRNQLAPGTEGGVTTHLPSGEVMSIFDAAMKYQADGVPLIVIAGQEYGSGSSRDWAAKGPMLQGIRAAIAESFERIHRSNLVGMGILPLQFQPGENRTTLGLTGAEVFDIEGIAEGLAVRKVLTVRARRADGSEVTFQAVARLDSPIDIEYYRHGGILQYVLRQLTRS